MAHTDLFIYFPVAFWTFIFFWVIYLLYSGYFLPVMYKSYRVRSLYLEVLKKQVVIDDLKLILFKRFQLRVSGIFSHVKFFLKGFANYVFGKSGSFKDYASFIYSSYDRFFRLP